MRTFKIFGKELISWGTVKNQPQKPNSFNPKTLPPGRVSSPNITNPSYTLSTLGENLSVITPEFNFEVIPIIRKLVKVNPDLSQALDNMVQLGNTGHQVKFDASVPAAQINKMRAHLEAKKLEWGDSEAGMDGLVNKLISQIMVSGALSNEWVPNFDLTGISKLRLINPEEIRWVYDHPKDKYLPYQRVNDPKLTVVGDNLIKLNTNTFKYFGLNGDTECPYGIPPYLAALDHVVIQKTMLDNIKFIVEQAGVLGFLEVLLEKPDIEGGESQDKYRGRLEQYLVDARKKIQEGYRDGVSVGYKGDHEFQFHSTTKQFTGVSELFQLNELLVSSGIKMDASMLGRSYGTSETQITVIFTKLLSQLKNIQALVKRNLEFGYTLELRLAGFAFNNLTVEFNPSTALDELKAQQADEIKIRNLNALYLDGIISQEQYAHTMGYEEPSEKEPRFIRAGIQTKEEADQAREKKKDESDKKVRSKNKPVEKTLK